MILDELGEIASGAALRDEEELHAARGDVPDGVENACKIGVRRELREGVQLACVEILEGLVILPAYLKHFFTLKHKHLDFITFTSQFEISEYLLDCQRSEVFTSFQ